MSVEIEIAGKRYPVPQAPTITKSISSLEDPKKISGMGSKRSLQVPAGKDALFPATAAPGPDVRKLQEDANLLVDGLPVAAGKAIATEQQRPARRSGGDRVTEVSFIGDNADWFSRIKDVRITDLIDFGSHTLNDDVLAYGNNSVDTNNDFCYCLIKRRNWKETGYVRIHEHTPAIFLARIFQAAFESIGYKLTSQFLATDFCKRLILPVPLKPYDNEYIRNNIDAFVATSSPIAMTHPVLAGPVINENHPIVFGVESFPHYDDGDNYNSSTGVYKVPAIEGEYTIDLNYKVTGVVAGGSYQARILKNGIVVGSSDLLTTDQEGTARATGVVVGSFDDEFTFEILTLGQSIGFTIQYEGWVSISYSSSEFLDNSIIKLNSIIPRDWKFEDIFKDCTFLFNWLVETNVYERTVRIEPRDPHRLRTTFPISTETAYDGFQNGPTHELDGLKVLDTETLTTINPERDNRQRYSYGEGDDTSEYLEAGYEVDLLGSAYVFEDDGTEEEGNQNTDFFAKAVHIQDTEVAHPDSAVAPQFVLQYDDNFYDRDNAHDETSFDPPPTILYFAGRRSGKDGWVKLKTVTDADLKYDFPAAFQVNYNDTSGFDPSLSFGNERLNNGMVVPGLVQTFHLHRLAILRNNLKLTVSLQLSVADYLRFGFADIYLLDGVRYTLNEITGFRLSANGVATVELLPQGVAYVEDKDRLTHSSIQSLIRV